LEINSPELAAIMTRRKQAEKTAKNLLDTFSEKRGRGRPPKVVASAIAGRAENFRGILPRIWSELEPRLLEAQTDDEVVKAFQIAQPGGNEFSQLAPLILKIVTDPKFPKRQRARINFLADSVAGVGLVTPRRSRDICAKDRKDRAILEQAPHILRYEFYIECSCGYRGKSRNHACPKCGAQILFPANMGSHIF
jgi:hypothetical protein